jgi:hypothetical protein
MEVRDSNTKGNYETLLSFWECTENWLNQMGEILL